MLLIKKDYPLILFKGMNSDLLNTVTDTYILNWTNDILDSLNTKEEFSELLTTTFKDNLVTNNVNDSTFDNDSDSHAVCLRYGRNYSRLSNPITQNLILACKNADNIFSISTKSKPNQIQISIIPKMIASRALFALCFIGKNTGEVNIPFSVAHTTSSNYIYTNNFNTTLNKIVSNELTTYTIDIPSQCPTLFLEQDTEWFFNYINVLTYVGANSVSGYPIYLKELIIKG